MICGGSPDGKQRWLAVCVTLFGVQEGEEAPEFKEGKDPDLEEWPTKGTIDVNKVIMRYRPSLPAVLKQVSFSVRTPPAAAPLDR